MTFVDPYTLEESELRVLQSEPVSFLIIGKPRCGKSEVARYIAKHWGVKLVSEIPLIENEQESSTPLGAEINERLESGYTIDADITSKLYIDALHSEAAEHYGVVIDGIPDINNKDLTDLIKKKVKIIIHMKISDNDITNARNNTGYDPVTGRSICFLGSIPEPEEGEGEGGEDSNETEVAFNPKNIIETLKWVRHAENTEPLISASIETYNVKNLEKYESILVNCEQFGKGIVIDICSFCGFNIDDINKQVVDRIHAIDPPRALVPIELKRDEELPEELATEELLRTVREFNKPSAKFRWKRSRWGRYCPVALAEGEIVTGSPTLALAFLGKMYFFSSPERMENFKINPRKYILPQTPRNPVRVAVTGQPSAGKTTLVKTLAEYYGCEIITPAELVVDELQNAKKEAYNKRKAECTELSIAMVQTALGKDEKVDENDPRVQEKVNEQMATKNDAVALPPAVYVQKIKDKIDEIAQKRIQNGENVSLGRWVIDGFPNTKEDWNAMADVELFPDDLVIIRDQTDRYEHIIECHYQMKKEKYDREFALRMTDEMKQSSDEGIDAAEDRPNRPGIDAPEFETFRGQLRTVESVLTQLSSQIHQPELFVLQLKYIYDPDGDQMFKETMEHIDARFKIHGWAWSGLDQQDEEDDNAVEEEEAGEDDEDDKKKRAWGNTAHYDPVVLHHTNILVPGSNEAQVKYKESIYCFQDNENREVFLADPTKYINPADGPLNPPPLRLCCIGQRAAGKSHQMRQIAREQNIFHIDFRKLLEEKLMPRFNKRLGPDHAEQNRLNDEADWHRPEKIKEILAEIVYPPVEKDDPTVTEADLGELEEAIKGHLEMAEPIPYEVLDTILAKFWREEPFKSRGFIMEGFPSCSDDVRYLIGSGQFPDAVLTINCDDDVAIKRIMPERVQLWKEWHSLKEQRLKTLRNHRLDVREEWVKARVAENIAEQPIEDGMDLATVEADQRERVMEEFQEGFLEVEDETPETLEDADERIRTEITDEYSLQQERCNNITDMLEEAQIPHMEVSGNRKPEQVAERLHKTIEEFLPPNRESLFEKVTPISHAACENLLKSNYMQLSSFGRWDPVLLKEGNVFRPLSTQDGAPSFPLTYGPYIYFLSSIETRNKFMTTPLEYIKKREIDQTPPPPNPIKLAIVGPPKSGKTTLAKRFSVELGVMKISIEDIVQLLVSKYSNTIIAQNIHAILLNGKELPTDLLMIGLDQILLDERCSTRGYIFDGFPSNMEQFQAMQRRSILPFRIIELDITDDECRQRNQREIKEKIKYYRDLEMSKIYPKPESDEGEEEEAEDMDEDEKPDPTSSAILAEDQICVTDNETIMNVFIQTFRRDIVEIRSAYQNLYRNWNAMNGKVNRWKLWHDAFSYVSKSVSKLQQYMKNIENGSISSLDGICITPNEYKARVGRFGNFCPVSLMLRNELVDCSAQEGMKFVVEWTRQYYRVAGKRELDLIMADPEKYLGTDLLLPSDIPVPLPIEATFQSIQQLGGAELDGFCPITYRDNGLTYDSLLRGSESFGAMYKNKLYLMSSDCKREKFLRRPNDYVNMHLPSKLPPKPEPIVTVSLPTGGFLEQGVARLLTDGIHAVGTLKPKFPFISVTDSSLHFVSIYLKAHNPRLSFHTRERWREILKEFKTDCDNISFLGRKMTRRYRPVDQRLAELDNRLKRFFDLKEMPEYLKGVPDEIQTAQC